MYYHAFCEHAAATQLADRSARNVKLLNFHARATTTIDSLVARGLLSPQIPCISCNKGHLQPVLYPLAVTIIVVLALESTQHYCVLPSSDDKQPPHSLAAGQPSHNKSCCQCSTLSEHNIP